MDLNIPEKFIHDSDREPGQLTIATCTKPYQVSFPSKIASPFQSRHSKLTSVEAQGPNIRCATCLASTRFSWKGYGKQSTLVVPCRRRLRNCVKPKEKLNMVTALGMLGHWLFTVGMLKTGRSGSRPHIAGIRPLQLRETTDMTRSVFRCTAIYRPLATTLERV